MPSSEPDVRTSSAAEPGSGLAAAPPDGPGAEDAVGRALVDDAHLATLARLVAGVAHELNTPLGAIHSNHDVIARALGKLQDILEDEVVTPDELSEVRRVVRAMDGVLRTNGIAVQRMVRLVESLGTFGRPDRAEIDRMDVREGLDGTLAVLAHELKPFRVVRELDDVPPIECFPNRLNQVFMNLIHNAAQAMDAGGTLTVRTRPDGDGVRVEIEDTGRGIAPGDLARIFEAGFTTKGGRVGMGLGLAISRQIVDQHGGRIEAESSPGQGTVFRVWLPLSLPGRTQGGDR